MDQVELESGTRTSIRQQQSPNRTVYWVGLGLSAICLAISAIAIQHGTLRLVCIVGFGMLALVCICVLAGVSSRTPTPPPSTTDTASQLQQRQPQYATALDTIASSPPPAYGLEPPAFHPSAPPCPQSEPGIHHNEVPEELPPRTGTTTAAPEPDPQSVSYTDYYANPPPKTPQSIRRDLVRQALVLEEKAARLRRKETELDNEWVKRQRYGAVLGRYDDRFEETFSTFYGLDERAAVLISMPARALGTVLLNAATQLRNRFTPDNLAAYQTAAGVWVQHHLGASDLDSVAQEKRDKAYQIAKEAVDGFQEQMLSDAEWIYQQMVTLRHQYGDHEAREAIVQYWNNWFDLYEWYYRPRQFRFSRRYQQVTTFLNLVCAFIHQ